MLMPRPDPVAVDATPQAEFSRLRRMSMAVSVGRTSTASSTEKLKVGDAAPDFELGGHRGGEKFKLSDMRGKKNVVLVFYPLDWTPV
jgi:peroxiredoxin